jgi:hypothetical protein
MTIAILELLLIKISIIFLLSLSLYSISSVLSGNNLTALAQQDLETVKYRDLIIDLGNGLKTNAQLTIPAVGEGPFPGVVIFLVLVVLQCFHRHPNFIIITLIWPSISQTEDLPYFYMTREA